VPRDGTCGRVDTGPLGEGGCDDEVTRWRLPATSA
jgi:hypothetical protein